MASEPNIETTDEFRGEYELALETWLRRRFSGLCATLFAIEALGIAGWVLMLVTTSPSDEPTPDDSTISPFIALMLLSAGVLGWFYYRVVPKLEAREEIIHAASTMIVALGMIDLVAMMMPDVGANGLLGIYFIHLVSSLFLPWSPGDSIRPMVPLLATWLVIKLITATATGPALLGLEIVASPLGFPPRTRRLRPPDVALETAFPDGGDGEGIRRVATRGQAGPSHPRVPFSRALQWSRVRLRIRVPAHA